MRSISCMVCAVKYDSPQAEHDHMGMRSMTKRSAPLPKLRVTYFNCGLALPQFAHDFSAEVDGDDDELPARADFGDDFAGEAFEGSAADDVLRFPRGAVSLALDDCAREDDAFEIENAEVVIFKFVRGVRGDYIAERPNQMAKLRDRPWAMSKCTRPQPPRLFAAA